MNSDWHTGQTLAPLIVKRCPRCLATFGRRDDKPRCSHCQNEREARAP